LLTARRRVARRARPRCCPTLSRSASLIPASPPSHPLGCRIPNTLCPLLSQPGLAPPHYHDAALTALAAASSVHLTVAGVPLFDLWSHQPCHGAAGAAPVARAAAASCCCRLVAAAFVFAVAGCGLVAGLVTWYIEFHAKRAFVRQRYGRRLALKLPFGAERLGPALTGGASVQHGAPCPLLLGFCAAVLLWYASEAAVARGACAAACAAACASAGGAGGAR
jgi:hypothetical protein